MADKEFLKSLLNRQMHITVSDGREFRGQLMCTDKDGSAILNETYEHKGDSKRFVGLVVIPGKHARKVELLDDDAAYS